MRLIDILHYEGIANTDQEELILALRRFSERNIDIVDCILCVKAKLRRRPSFLTAAR